jgi:hypothetical protein
MNSILTGNLLLIVAPLCVSAQTPGDLQPTIRGSLPANTVVAVTTDGLWVPSRFSSTPLLHVPAAQFPGEAAERGSLTRPAIEWDGDSDTYLISSGPQLFQFRIIDLSSARWVVKDITPDPATTFSFWDIDIHPGSGELYLLDQTNDEVLRFARPFSAGMLPDLVLPVPGTSRCMALDSAIYPPAVIVGETSQATRVYLDGTTELLSLFSGSRGLAQDPQVAGDSAGGGALMVSSNSNQVAKAVGDPGLLVGMNFLGLCAPLALRPTDIEWNTNRKRAYVFSELGINPERPWCTSVMVASGPNHIVIFPVAQAAPNIIPKLYTFAGGSGITGTEGDLTMPLADFAFNSPYGQGCTSGTVNSLTLSSSSVPIFTATELPFELRNASPRSTATLIVGLMSDEVPIAGGCSLLASADLLVAAGTTDAKGNLDFTWPLPVPPSPGLELFVQVAVDNTVTQELTPAIRIHFGL